MTDQNARRDLVAAAIHRYDQNHALTTSNIPTAQHRGEAEAALAAIDAERPPAQSDTEILRAAAARVQALLDGAAQEMTNSSYWSGADDSAYVRGIDNAVGGPAGAYAAALHPGVGRALVFALEAAAEDAERRGDTPTLIILAQRLLGGDL